VAVRCGTVIRDVGDGLTAASTAAAAAAAVETTSTMTSTERTSDQRLTLGTPPWLHFNRSTTTNNRRQYNQHVASELLR